MSRISVVLKKTIKEIKRLSDGSIDDQLKACNELLQKKIFSLDKLKTGIPVSVVQELLPTIIKFMESDNHELQQEGALVVIYITMTPDKKANTKLLIDADVITKLKNLLSSTNTNLLARVLRILANIAYYFPEKLENEILQQIIQFLNSENDKISYEAAGFMCPISYRSEEQVAAIFEANGVEALITLLESKNDATIKCVLLSLENITSCNNQYCQRVLDLGALESLKKLCDRLFAVKKPRRSNVKVDRSKLEEEKMIKWLVIRLIKAVTSYGETQIDLIIKENIIPIILQQIKSGSTLLIKIESIKVIENVIDVKPDFIPAIVQDYNIFSFCYSNLESSNINLIIATLTAMSNIIELFEEDRDSIRQKIRECGGSTKLSNLLEHSDEGIRHLSTMIYEFVFDVKPDPIAGVSTGSNQQEPEVIELNEDDATPFVKTPRISRQRKRPATTTVGPLRRSKRFRVSLEQTDTDNTDSSSDDDDENGQNNDFDDHSISSSPANSAPVAAPIESNRHDYSGRQSFIVEDTVADDGSFQLHLKAEPTSQSYDMLPTSASLQSPDLPLTASTNNEISQDEMKPSTSGLFVNQSRRASNDSHAVLEAVSSTNDENIRHDHSGRQSFIGEGTVAADRHSRLNLKIESPPTPQDYITPSASRQSPYLLVASSTHNETDPDEMKPSLADRFGNSSRFSSNNFHAVLEAVSTTNDGNIRNNHAGSQIVVNSETAATADENIRNGINPGKRSPIDADFGNPLSRPTSAIAPALPLTSASTNNGTMPNAMPSKKPSPVPQSIITPTFTNQVTPPAAATNNDDVIRDEIIKYWHPAEFFIDQYCDTLEIQFSRKHYSEFMSKIEINQITSNSKPANIFQPIDQTGFGCLSILLTGNEDASSAIRMKINKKFVDDLSQSGNFDEEIIAKTIAPPFLMKEEHFETIATWLKCQILVYCNGWKKYGNWDEENPMIPIFVLNKKEIDGKTEYCIVLTLKND